MEKHITLAAVLNIGLGILGLLFACVVFVVIAGGGLISGDPEAMAITMIVGSVIAVFFIVLSLPKIIGGIGLLKRRRWARIVLLIISVMALIDFPIGTALGIYTIWVLLQDETIRLLETTPSHAVDTVRKPTKKG